MIGVGKRHSNNRVTIALPAYYNTPIGGYHVHYTYANLLAKRGYDVTVAFPRYARGADGIGGRLKTAVWATRLRLQNRPLVERSRLSADVRVRLLRNLTGSALPDADVLVATAWETAEALAEAPARAGHKFYVVYDYEHWMTADAERRRRMAATYRQPFTIVSTSGVVDSMIRSCGGVPAAKVPCGYDPNEFSIDVPLAQRLPLSVGFPVRGEAFKGTADAVAAVTLLRQRYGDRIVVTAFGGQGNGLPDWVRWLQRPSQVKLRRFYNQASVFLLPSHYEGWGLPGIEAMACGAALVTADNGGSRDYAVDGETALVVPPREPEKLAAAVAQLFEDDDLRRRIAGNGNDFVRRFSWDTAVSKLERVFATARHVPIP